MMYLLSKYHFLLPTIESNGLDDKHINLTHSLPPHNPCPHTDLILSSVCGMFLELVVSPSHPRCQQLSISRMWRSSFRAVKVGRNQPHNLILLFSQTEITTITFPELSSTTYPFEHPLSSPPISVLVDVDTSSLLIGTAQSIVSFGVNSPSVTTLFPHSQFRSLHSLSNADGNARHIIFTTHHNRPLLISPPSNFTSHTSQLLPFQPSFPSVFSNFALRPTCILHLNSSLTHTRTLSSSSSTPPHITHPPHFFHRAFSDVLFVGGGTNLSGSVCQYRQAFFSRPLTEVSIDSLLSQNPNFSLENASVVALPSTADQRSSIVVAQTPSNPPTILLSHSNAPQSLFVIPPAVFMLSEDHPHSLYFHLQDASLTRIQVTSSQISLLNMTVPSSFAQFTAKDNPHTLFKATKENPIVLPLSQPYSKSLLAYPFLVLHSPHTLRIVNLLRPTQPLFSAPLKQTPSEQLLACFVCIDKLFCVMSEWGSDTLALFVLNTAIPSDANVGDSSGQRELKSEDNRSILVQLETVTLPSHPHSSSVFTCDAGVFLAVGCSTGELWSTFLTSDSLASPSPFSSNRQSFVSLSQTPVALSSFPRGSGAPSCPVPIILATSSSSAILFHDASKKDTPFEWRRFHSEDKCSFLPIRTPSPQSVQLPTFLCHNVSSPSFVTLSTLSDTDTLVLDHSYSLPSCPQFVVHSHLSSSVIVGVDSPTPFRPPFSEEDVVADAESYPTLLMLSDADLTTVKGFVNLPPNNVIGDACLVVPEQDRRETEHLIVSLQPSSYNPISDIDIQSELVTNVSRFLKSEVGQEASLGDMSSIPFQPHPTEGLIIDFEIQPNSPPRNTFEELTEMAYPFVCTVRDILVTRGIPSQLTPLHPPFFAGVVQNTLFVFGLIRSAKNDAQPVFSLLHTLVSRHPLPQSAVSHTSLSIISFEAFQTALTFLSSSSGQNFNFRIPSLQSFSESIPLSFLSVSTIPSTHWLLGFSEGFAYEDIVESAAPQQSTFHRSTSSEVETSLSRPLSERCSSFVLRCLNILTLSLESVASLVLPGSTPPRLLFSTQSFVFQASFVESLAQPFNSQNLEMGTWWDPSGNTKNAASKYSDSHFVPPPSSQIPPSKHNFPITKEALRDHHISPDPVPQNSKSRRLRSKPQKSSHHQRKSRQKSLPETHHSISHSNSSLDPPSSSNYSDLETFATDALSIPADMMSLVQRSVHAKERSRKATRVKQKWSDTTLSRSRSLVKTLSHGQDDAISTPSSLTQQLKGFSEERILLIQKTLNQKEQAMTKTLDRLRKQTKALSSAAQDLSALSKPPTSPSSAPISFFQQQSNITRQLLQDMFHIDDLRLTEDESTQWQMAAVEKEETRDLADRDQTIHNAKVAIAVMKEDVAALSKRIRLKRDLIKEDEARSKQIAEMKQRCGEESKQLLREIQEMEGQLDEQYSAGWEKWNVVWVKEVSEMNRQLETEQNSLESTKTASLTKQNELSLLNQERPSLEKRQTALQENEARLASRERVLQNSEVLRRLKDETVRNQQSLQREEKRRAKKELELDQLQNELRMLTSAVGMNDSQLRQLESTLHSTEQRLSETHKEKLRLEKTQQGEYGLSDEDDFVTYVTSFLKANRTREYIVEQLQTFMDEAQITSFLEWLSTKLYSITERSPPDTSTTQTTEQPQTQTISVPDSTGESIPQSITPNNQSQSIPVRPSSVTEKEERMRKLAMLGIKDPGTAPTPPQRLPMVQPHFQPVTYPQSHPPTLHQTLPQTHHLPQMDASSYPSPQGYHQIPLQGAPVGNFGKQKRGLEQVEMQPGIKLMSMGDENKQQFNNNAYYGFSQYDEYGQPLPCPKGASCPRTGCQYSHPPEPCKFGQNCQNGYCMFSHDPPCMYDRKCSNPYCTFAHYASHEQRPLCKFGNQCRRTNCTYRHPNRATLTGQLVASVSISNPEPIATKSEQPPPAEPTVQTEPEQLEDNTPKVEAAVEDGTTCSEQPSQ
ncbi:hypothetical protein BLNAU_3749 [Blattamonas nauphoetae]|uniref:C3H1-type domain-containing protein n=1 Tax=Blattamonas nauphoetae TaxID=2049346 RepID=A0ABQ9YC13_9EUKA|nr:hypothetical protein BLNAU_3749 [Blattamonas nauphoetae]